jgi:hypothetical protein
LRKNATADFTIVNESLEAEGDRKTGSTTSPMLEMVSFELEIARLLKYAPLRWLNVVHVLAVVTTSGASANGMENSSTVASSIRSMILQ